MGEREKELHEKLHRSQKSRKPDLLSHPRLKLFALAESASGTRMSGRVIDLGAGDGYAGAWLASQRDVEVTALEHTEEAVRLIIPRTAACLGVQDRLTPVLGSFEDLSSFRGFDHAISFGALHHSPDLYRVIRNVSQCLKPGAILMFQEPCAPDRTSNEAYRKVYDSPEVFAGETILNRERHDHFFRRCEYLTALHFNDFEILHESDVGSILDRGTIAARIRRIMRGMSRPSTGLSVVADPAEFPRFRMQQLRPVRWFVVCRKPSMTADVPHKWDGL